jgi:aminoglycoside 6'-N-acetyltransferase I
VALEVRFLGANDLAVLEHIAPDVFDDAINPRYAQEFLSDPRHHLIVALEDDLVVGFVSAVHYVHPDSAPELFINEISVSPDWQRHGIATRLMNAMFARARELGCIEAWLGTERDNVAARGLYSALGGVEEEFVLYSFDLSVLSRKFY